MEVRRAGLGALGSLPPPRVQDHADGAAGWAGGARIASSSSRTGVRVVVVIDPPHPIQRAGRAPPDGWMTLSLVRPLGGAAASDASWMCSSDRDAANRRSLHRDSLHRESWRRR